MCTKQTSVSHSSTEAELISLDAGLRMDGVPALDLWDLVVEVFHSSPTESKKTKGQARGNSLRDTTSIKHTQNQTKDPTKCNNPELSTVDYVSSNSKSSLFGAMLYILEDNEAVIKMIIKGRSPTMRHVSITHRVALDWWCDRINLDPNIQIRYIDTKHQIADILTEGNFTRDEWNNLLHLYNISHVSSACCAQNFSLISCPKKMAKRVQEQKEEERVVVKSRPTAMNLSSTVPASSSSAKNLITSSDPVKLIAAGKPASRTRRNLRPDGAPSSQVKLKDVYFGGLMDDSAGKPVATEENEVSWDFSESESWSVHEGEETGEPVAYKKSAGKPAASSVSENSGDPKAETKKWPHKFNISSKVVTYMDKVHSTVRKTYDRGPTDEMEDLNVNAAIW